MTFNNLLKMAAVISALALSPSAAFAQVDCDIYADAIETCAIPDGCSTTIDDFAACLVDEEGIAGFEIDEVVHCFHTEYYCE